MPFDSLSTTRLPVLELFGSGSISVWNPNSLGTNYPRLSLQVGNTTSDVNTGLQISPAQSSAGVQIPTLIQVSTNKATNDAGAKQITLYVDQNYAAINTIASDSVGGSPVPLHFLVGNYLNTSRNGMIINSDAENTVTIGSDTIQTTAQLNVVARGTLPAAQFTGNVGLTAANGAYFGYTSFTTGMTVDFRFGDVNNRLVNTFGSTLNLESYHGSVISCNASGSNTGLRVHVKGTNTTRNLLEWGRNTTYSPQGTVFANGNMLLQAGGTHADNGYKIEVQGTALISGVTTLSNLGGSGSQMVVVDNAGVLSKQAIPGGSSGYTVNSQTTAYSVTATSGTLIVQGDTTTAGFTITLPTAVGNTAMIVIKKTAGANSLTVGTTSSQTIDGATTAVLTRIYESITLVSNNANWLII